MSRISLNQSLDSTFLQEIELSNTNEHYISSHKFNLYQQFFIIGLDPKIMSNINDIEINSLPPQLIEPQIISKYPKTPLPYLTIPDSIIASHCFPNGIKKKLITVEDQGKNIEEDFIFSFENQGYEDKDSSLRTKRVYYTCYLFYENIEDYRQCINLRKKIKINNENPKNKGLLIPKVICLSSFSPLYKQTIQILHYLKQYIDNHKYSQLSTTPNNSNNNINIKDNSFPIEKIIEGLIFNIPGLPRAKYSLKLTKNTFYTIEKNDSSNNNNNNNLGANKKKDKDNNKKEKEKNKDKNKETNIEANKQKEPEDIIFENAPANKTPLPILDYCHILHFFQIDDIFEIIKWIILEVPILFFSENITNLSYTIESFLSLIYPFEYSYPIISVLPEENYPLISIYKHFIFGINAKYNKDIFAEKGINIENKKLLIIVSIDRRFEDPLNFKEKDKLTSIPIITTLKSDRDKPIIKLDQLMSYYSEKNQIEMKRNEQGNEKKRKVTLPLHYKEKSRKKYIENIELKVKETLNKKKKKKLSQNDISQIVSNELCETVLNFFINIFLHYQEYCFKLERKKDLGNNPYVVLYEKDDIIEQKYNENKLNIKELFQCANFINTIPQADRLFYSLFFCTKIFHNFIMKKIFPISIQDKLDVLFFDERINEKIAKDTGNKKISTPFLKHEFNNVTDIELSSFRKPIAPDYREFLLQKQNQDKALNYFQYIIKIENDNDNFKKPCENDSTIALDEDNNYFEEINFYYFVFPKLLNDDIFYKEDYTIEKFWSPERNLFTSSNSNCLYNQFEKEGKIILNNKDNIQKYEEYNYSLNIISTFNVKMKDYIHLLWLQYFAKTFHYTPLSERKKQFDQMMTVLKTIPNIVDQNTFNILFNTINRYGDRNMNQDLFINLKNKTYISFLCLREKTKSQNNFIEYNIDDSQDQDKKIKMTSSIHIQSNKSSLRFDENSFCCNKLCKEAYNVQEKFLFNESIGYNDNFIKFKCGKCSKEQHIQVKSIYDNGFGKGININFRLISPLALLKRKWFQDKLDLDLFYVCQEHLEPYMSAMFYFYLQGIFCGFMIPEKRKENNFSIEKNQINLEFSKSANATNVTDKNKIIIESGGDKIIQRQIFKSINVDVLKQEVKKGKKDIKIPSLPIGGGAKKEYLFDHKTIAISRNVKQGPALGINFKDVKSVDFGKDVIDLDTSDDKKKFFEYREDSSKDIKKNNNNKKNKKISLIKQELFNPNKFSFFGNNKYNFGQLSSRNFKSNTNTLFQSNSQRSLGIHKPNK